MARRWFAAVLVAVVAGGCDRTTASRRVGIRQERIARTLADIGRSERARPAKLAAARAALRESAVRDAEDRAAHFANYERWARQSVERWQARGPVYRSEAARLLGPRPQRVPGLVTFD